MAQTRLAQLRQRLWPVTDPRARRRTAILALLVALSLLPQLVLWGWFVDDAAISYAYARHLADGDGLVPFVGGERLEGYSNPLWVLLLALFALVGVDGFAAAKPLALGLTLVALWLTHRAARLGAPGDEAAPLVAVGALAVSATFGIWQASGLENALLSAALAAGIWRTLREGERGGFPFAALIWLAVALTRPEGLLYAGWGAAWSVLLDRRTARPWRRSLQWLALFLGPLALYHAARIWYFAQVLPTPFHAKLGGGAVGPHAVSTAQGLAYLGRYAVATGAALIAPLAVAALVDRRSRRSSGLCAGLCAGVLLFTILAGGDWMAGFRFASYLAVPAALLTASGCAVLGPLLARAGRPRLATALAPVLVLAYALPNALFASGFKPPLSAERARQRLEFYADRFDRLLLDRPFVAVDHDMGAFAYWLVPEAGRVIDTRGLLDLRFALHRRRAGFAADYLFEEQRFDLCHAHASTGWVLRRIPAFGEEYIEIPGYPAGREIHGANYLRKDLIVAPGWDRPRRGPGRHLAREIGGGLSLEGYEVPSPAVAAGGALFLRLGLSARRTLPGLVVDVTARGSASADHTWTIAPGYDDWYPPSRWRAGEVVVDRRALPLPADLPEGHYALAFGFRQGRRWLGERDGGPVSIPAGAFEVVDRHELVRVTGAQLLAATMAASSSDCPAAEGAWERAWRHNQGDMEWRRTERPRVARAIAECWARRGTLADSPSAIGAALERARRWDAAAPAVEEVGAGLAARLVAEGRRHRVAGRAAEAFSCFENALRADPTRAWARRWAEELRAERLGRDADPGEVDDGPEREPD